MENKPEKALYVVTYTNFCDQPVPLGDYSTFEAAKKVLIDHFRKINPSTLFHVEMIEDHKEFEGIYMSIEGGHSTEYVNEKEWIKGKFFVSSYLKHWEIVKLVGDEYWGRKLAISEEIASEQREQLDFLQNMVRKFEEMLSEYNQKFY